MLKENTFKIYFTLLVSILFCIFSNDIVDASYKYCDKQIAGTDYYDCGQYIYTYYEDTSHSSMIYAAQEGANIIYVGEIEGVSVFYASGIRYYNNSYDDTSRENKDLWSAISTQGKEVYDGSFTDSWMLDDSHQGFYYYPLKRDVYSVKQYVKGNLYRSIAIYNIDKNSIDINTVKYDDVDIYQYSQDVLEAKKGISANISAKYGAKDVIVKIDDQIVDSNFNGINVVVMAENINKHLKVGNEVNLEITAYNYFSGYTTFKTKLRLVNDTVSISFSTMSSIIESSSRRILIQADPGKGKELDTDYCWYYWSTSGDDSLDYDEFLKNYANSSYKGSYSEGKGVILRDTSGTYYLYALAKDDDSWVIQRSEGYVLNNVHPLPKYNITDIIFVIVLLIIAIIPIIVHIIIRKKGY